MVAASIQGVIVSTMQKSAGLERTENSPFLLISRISERQTVRNSFFLLVSRIRGRLLLYLRSDI